MVYRIRYHYKTGNSFGSHNETEELDLTWENQEVARENLKRIKDHYNHYELFNQFYKTPEDLKNLVRILKELPTKDWYVKDKYDGDNVGSTLKLKTDDGKDWQFWAPWCGYFESLHSAEIVSDLDKIEFI